jgi:cyclohexadienyl dehydratase
MRSIDRIAVMWRRFWQLLAALGALSASQSGCAGTGPSPRGAPLVVGTSGDYAPFSYRAPGELQLRGFDIAVARAFARERGRELRLVEFGWPELLRDLAAKRFDVAMSGVTVRPDRSLAGRFSVPVARSGAVVLVREPDAAAGIDALDQEGVVIAVNRGGHLERVSRARFGRAELRAIERNGDVLAELVEGRARAVVSDTLEAPHWLASASGLVALGPFTRDDKAYLVRPDRPELARELDAWLLARERDGTLATLREAHLGPGDWPRTSTPQAALDAASRERLALMPLVAEAKRLAESPIEDLAREQRVLEAAARSVERAARERGVPPVPEDEVRRFFEARIEAAKRVQRAVLAEPPDPLNQGADLEREIRPALIRIGDRIAMLLVERWAEQPYSEASGTTSQSGAGGLSPASTQRSSMKPSRRPPVSIQLATPGSSGATTRVQVPSSLRCALPLFQQVDVNR